MTEKNIIREIFRIDEKRQIHIDVPPGLGEMFEVVLIPVRDQRLSAEDRFNLAAYAAIVEDDPEEDAIWENCRYE